MKPQHGVIATRPATAPEDAPTMVGLPSRIHSTMIQPSSAAAVATCVLTKATAVMPSAVISEPAAKSSACHCARKPPPQIQCATGTYTSVNQPIANTTQPPNLARSEIEPLISAVVMMANIIWKARIPYVGMPVEVPAMLQTSDTYVLVPRYCVKLPKNLLTEALSLVPKAILNP